MFLQNPDFPSWKPTASKCSDMSLINYTTKIPPEQTIGELQKALSKWGVSAMMTEYEGPQVKAVAFRMDIEGKQVAFRMPCNWRAVLELLKGPEYRGKLRLGKDTIEDQAIRTAWRVILVWAKAQLTLVEINMVSIPQVFLPYAITKDGRTLSEKINDDPGFLLTAG